MTLRKRVAALAATVVVGLGSVFVVASPAYAAPTCTTSKVSGTWYGTANGYYFNCYNSTSGGVWLEITCMHFLNPEIQQTLRYEHRPVGWPWSLGHTLRCSNREFASTPRWGGL